jgi:sialidase-1
MKKWLSYGYSMIDILLVYFFSRGIYLFLWKNEAIIKRYTLLQVLMWLIVVDLTLLLLMNSVLRFKRQTPLSLSISQKHIITAILILLNGLFIYTFLHTALFDYFQPFAIYDPAIYSILYGIVVLLIKTIIDVVRSYLTPIKEYYFLPQLDVLLLLLVVFIWGVSQTDYDMYQGENLSHLFEQGDNDYGSYRIPSILVLPKGTILEEGTLLLEDRILVFAEARKDGSPDHGNIDMVYRYSDDYGVTWSSNQYIDLGDNKLGNFAPVYDSNTGIIHMVHMRTFYDGSGANGAYVMRSVDGGETWGEAEQLYPGLFVGPGHGIQIEGGTYNGRLVVPGYGLGGFAYYSDDGGDTWITGGGTDQGDESAIAQLDQDTLVITTRHEIGMALPHGELFKLFATSSNGGTTFGPTTPHEDVMTPLCMSGLTSHQGTLYFSGPMHHQARANLTILMSNDSLQTFTILQTLYEGPSGYSDLGVLSNGNLVILFENGAVEYDQRLTFMIIEQS